MSLTKALGKRIKGGVDKLKYALGDKITYNSNQPKPMQKPMPTAKPVAKKAFKQFGDKGYTSSTGVGVGQ